MLACNQGSELTQKQRVIGIGKNGHPIYSPYKNDGSTWSSCDVDDCNGREIDGSYAYVTTFFHPYTIGCFGPASSTSSKVSCSANPRVCAPPLPPPPQNNSGQILSVNTLALLIMSFCMVVHNLL